MIEHGFSHPPKKLRQDLLSYYLTGDEPKNTIIQAPRISPKNLDSKIIFSYQEKKPSLIITISEEFITKKVGQMLVGQTIENTWQQLKFSYQKKENN